MATCFCFRNKTKRERKKRQGVSGVGPKLPPEITPRPRNDQDAAHESVYGLAKKGLAAELKVVHFRSKIVFYESL